METYKVLTNRKPETSTAMSKYTFGGVLMTFHHRMVSSELTAARIIPYLQSQIIPSLEEGKNVFVASMVIVFAQWL